MTIMIAVGIIWLGVFGYLFFLDRKLRSAGGK